MAHSKLSLFALLALVCAMGSGCTTSKHLSSDPAASEEIARGSANEAAVITFQDGNSKVGYDIAVRTDSTEWYSENRSVRFVSATSGVVSISVRTPNVLGGIAWGSGIGLLPSLVIGGIAELSVTPFFGEGNEKTENTAFMEGFGSGMAFSALLGGLIGNAHSTVYKP